MERQLITWLRLELLRRPYFSFPQPETFPKPSHVAEKAVSTTTPLHQPQWYHLLFKS